MHTLTGFIRSAHKVQPVPGFSDHDHRAEAPDYSTLEQREIDTQVETAENEGMLPGIMTQSSGNAACAAV